MQNLDLKLESFDQRISKFYILQVEVQQSTEQRPYKSVKGFNLYRNLL